MSEPLVKITKTTHVELMEFLIELKRKRALRRKPTKKEILAHVRSIILQHGGPASITLTIPPFTDS